MSLSSDKTALMGKTLPELVALVTALKQPKFRAQQLYRWIYARRETEIGEMTDLAKDFRALLEEQYIVSPLTVRAESVGFDGSIKLLFTLHDGAAVEGVIIPEGERTTVCLSSQVGCNLDCRFCATAGIGFKRNLSAGEIVGQLILLEKRAGRPITNVVMMGMGEPLLNRENVFTAARLITDPDGYSLSRRKFTISTAGWVPGIIALTDSGLKIKLAVSLNGSNEEQRARLMPRASHWQLEAIVAAAKEYAYRADIRVQFGYLLLHGINDTAQDAHRLIRLLSGVPAKINVMEYNEIGGEFSRTEPDEADRFAAILRDAGLTVTVRTSRGGDINAACGQLAGRMG